MIKDVNFFLIFYVWANSPYVYEAIQHVGEFQKKF